MRIKRNYYYLVAGLPDLLLDEGRMKIDMYTLKTEFQHDIHPDDFELVKYLYLKYDNQNLLNLLEKKTFDFDKRGNYLQENLEEQIKEQDGSLPQYMNLFIDSFKNDRQDDAETSWEIVLEKYFYQYLSKLDNEFLNDWFVFQLNTKNVLSAQVCRQFDLRIENQLIGDSEINSNLQRSNARDFGIGQDFPEIEKILSAWESDTLLNREKAIDMINWQWIDEHTFFHYFSIERILGFLLQFEMVERWMGLDRSEGEKMFNLLLDQLGRSYELPNEFKLQSITKK
jgi:hypothetical protein